MKRARRLHRPSLKNWECDGLHITFPAYVRSVLEGEQYSAFVPFGTRSNGRGVRPSKSQSAGDSIVETRPSIPAVLDAKTLSAREFIDNYEACGVPAVIANIPQGHDVPPPPPPRSGSNCESQRGIGAGRDNLGSVGAASFQEWRAMKLWEFTALEHDPDLRDRYFKCGEDDDGKSVRVKLKHFLKYLKDNRDDSPLYIFDSSFDEDKDAKRLLTDYRVPTYFSEDLFHLVSERRRPPYRWFLVGPERSGTTIHIDPLGTSAWNTLLHGAKRWVLFPPNVPKSVVKGRGLIRNDEDDEAIHYFMFILPRIKGRALDTGNTGDYENFECYEFTQNAGETVYVPNGWWHAVLNLTHTVGVTQNFCSQRNFNEVWVQTRSGRKKMAWKWLHQLDVHYPHLAETARRLNKRDNFVMKYDPVEVRRREKEEDRKRRSKREAREVEKAKAKEKKRKAKRERRRSKDERSHGTDRSEDCSVRSTPSMLVKDGLARESKRSRIESRHVSP